MEIKYEIKYHYLVVEEDIPKLDKINRNKVKEAIEEKLTTKPEFFGKPLRQSLKGYRKLRVRDYRIVFKIEKQTVGVLMIKHRMEVYQKALKRLS